MMNESYISIFVKSMRINLRIGLEDFEKEAPQPIDVSVELFTSPDYLFSADPDSIIDYAQIHECLKSWEAREHVELLETYMQEILELGFGFENVTAMRASISKPEIFEQAEHAGLEAFIHRQDYRP